jgi:4Fe-4S ferredoxin
MPMPMKEQKTDTQNEQTIKRILHAKDYSLTLDKKICKGCEVCSIICPREAVRIIKIPRTEGEKAKPPIIDFDEQKCSYCGMCEIICPFGALQVRVDNKRIVPVIEKGSFPSLIREIEVDTSKCKSGCVECENACPLELIKVTFLTPNGQEVKAEEAKKQFKKQSLKVRVDIKKDYCPCCRLCEMKCPEQTIHVRKIMHGLLKINFEKCPSGCQDCLDVCPIPGALFLKDGKVHTNEAFCVFCGVCKLVCPVEGALKMDRKSIYHTPVSSGAWNVALEKLTSTKEYSKEAKSKSSMKALKVVEKRLTQAKEGET